MTKTRAFISTAFIIILSGALGYFFLFSGAGWGLSSNERLALLLPDNFTDYETLYDAMINARAGFYSSGHNPCLIDKAQLADEKNVDFHRHGFNPYLSNALRHFFLCSNDPDENDVLNALANLKPSKLQLNPHHFEYGGTYTYSLAAAYKAGELAGAVTLVPNMKYYFRHTEKMADMYRWGRSYGALIGGAGILILALLYFKNTKSVFWAACFLAAALSAPAVLVSSKLLKPHFFASFFSALVLILNYYYFTSCKRKALLLQMLITGFLTGTVIQSVIIVILPMLTQIYMLVKEKISVKRFLADFVAGILLVAAGALITNPYWLITPAEVIAEFRFVANWHHFTLTGAAIYGYLRYQLLNGLGVFMLAAFVYALSGNIYEILKKRRLDGFNDITAIFVLCSVVILSGMGGAFAFSSDEVKGSIFILPVFFMFTVERLRRHKHPVAVKIAFLALLAFNLPYSYLTRSYYINDSGTDQSTRIKTGKWINENVDDTATIGTLADITPWTFPPAQLLRYKVKVYNSPEQLGADAEKPDYLVITYMNEQNPEYERKVLNSGYSIIKAFHNEPGKILFYRSYNFFSANMPMIIYKNSFPMENGTASLK